MHIVWKSNLETRGMPNTNSIDSHSISVQDLLQKVDLASFLNESLKRELTHTLANYVNYFISRPGKCTILEYNVTLTPFIQVMRSSDPFPSPYPVLCEAKSNFR
jgi:hypothetical protein